MNLFFSVQRMRHISSSGTLYMPRQFCGIALVFEYFFTEFLEIEFFPFACGPCGHVDAVGDVADVAFFP